MYTGVWLKILMVMRMMLMWMALWLLTVVVLLILHWRNIGLTPPWSATEAIVVPLLGPLTIHAAQVLAKRRRCLGMGSGLGGH